jgi:hypothetical protein
MLGSIENTETHLKPDRLKDTSLIEAVSEQVSLDLKTLLTSSVNIKNKLRLISEKMEIDKKTLLRLSEKGSKPNYITVFKIYRYLFNESDDAKVLNLCPAVIRQYLKNANPQTLEKNTSYTANIDRELHDNPIFSEIYVLVSTGPVQKSEIIKRFGTYGLNLTEKMMKLNVLAETRKDEFILGLNQATLKPETILSMGKQICNSYAKPENSYELDQNIIYFYSEGLSIDAFKKWIRIDHEAIQKKIALASKPESKGSIRAFTFGATDTLEQRNLKS